MSRNIKIPFLFLTISLLTLTCSIPFNKNTKQKQENESVFTPSEVTPTVELKRQFPVFGPITIALDVTEENFPINPAIKFEYGTKKIFGVFAYSNMYTGINYTVEWMLNGKEGAKTTSTWENLGDGMYYVSLIDDEVLPAGEYVVNLYIEDHIVQTKEFEILEDIAESENPDDPALPQRPALPSEVVDPEAMKYFEMVYYADLPVLKEIIQINLKNWTRVEVTDDNPCGPDAVACFQYSCKEPRTSAKVFLPRENMNQEDFRIAATLAHELTHGMEYYLGMPCGCTVEKEFYATVAQIDYLLYSGHEDYAYNNYGIVWDDSGNSRPDLVWEVVKKVYYSENCPEY